MPFPKDDTTPPVMKINLFISYSTILASNSEIKKTDQKNSVITQRNPLMTQIAHYFAQQQSKNGAFTGANKPFRCGNWGRHRR
jgi:7-cyano-7-deazaguanine synthase in queuosine biosynthesis